MYLKTYSEYWEGMLSNLHWLTCEECEVVLTHRSLKSGFVALKEVASPFLKMVGRWEVVLVCAMVSEGHVV